MRRLILCVSLLLAPAPALPAWEVPKFEIFCGQPADRFPDLTWRFYSQSFGQQVDRPAATDCGLDAEARSRLGDFAGRSLSRLESYGFASPSPLRLGPVVRGAQGDRVVRLFADPQFGGYLQTLAPCGQGGGVYPELLSVVTMNPQFDAAFSHPTVLRAIGHEMVHVLQNAYAMKTAAHTDGCGQDAGWFLEGTADALSVDISRQSFPSYNPPLVVRGSKSYYGLRPYDRALTWSPKDDEEGFLDRFGHPVIPDYRTSSLFMHLSDHYFEGDYGWLDGFFRVPDPKPGGDDWLAWFDQLLRKKGAGPELPLYLVFPDFLGNYATWGAKKHPHIGEKRWLDPSFGGCHVIWLSRDEPVRELELDLEPISGQCLQVRSVDPKVGEVAQVMVMAYGASEQEVDNLHLAVARMSAKVLELGGGAYDCWELSKQHRREPVCISKPYVGKKEAEDDSGVKQDLGPEGWAKVWASVHQEGTEELLDNLYVLVHTPVHPRIAEHASGKKQHVRVVVGLEFPTLASSTHGASGRTTASIDNNLVEPIPMQSGEDAMAGLMAAAAGDPEAISKLPFLMNNVPALPADAMPAMAQGDGIRTVRISRAKAEAGPGGAVELDPTLQLQLFVAESTIPFGASGSYPAYVMGTDLEAMASVTGSDVTANLMANPQAAAMAMLGPQMTNLYPDRPSATIEVVEWSDELLRLKVSGEYCRGSDWDDRPRRCRSPQSFSGEVIKPFGWAYDSTRPFVSVDTPGMAVYRRQMHELLRQRGMPLPPMPGVGGEPPAGSDGEPAGPDGGPGSAGGGAVCDCSCEAFAQLKQLGKENKESGAERPSTEMASLAQCSAQCMSQWMSCPRR